MMKVVRQDLARSAVTASPGMAATRPHYGRFIPTIVNSLFDASRLCLRAANPVNFRYFRRRAIGRRKKFPVIFLVSREFMRLDCSGSCQGGGRSSHPLRVRG
jgi:hypothetical protein